MGKFILFAALIVVFSSCLKTRNDLAGNEQSKVYGRKNADNQAASQSQLATQAPIVVDERDDLIRGFNGRIESLENQITNLQKEKAALANSAETQKLQLMQDALVKMEAQIQRLEAEALAAAKAPPPSSDMNAPKASSRPTTAKLDSAKKEAAATTGYDIAQEHFGSKEWKKAILSYQKYVDDNSRGKNVADAKYKIGVCFQELGMKEEAMAFYEEVIANYSKTEAGKKAKIRLTKLKK